MTLYAERLPECCFCQREIDPNGKQTMRRVFGWEKVRKGGEGTQALKDRQFTMEFAHVLCLDVKLAGEDPKAMYVKESLL